jgi:outer membrane protein TolC
MNVRFDKVLQSVTGPRFLRWVVVLGILLSALSANAVLGQTPLPAATTPLPTQADSQIRLLTLDEALRLAQAAASAYEQAKFTERSAEEDVRQARAAFLPRIAGQPTVIYTSPSSAPVPSGAPRTFSFIGANAITEYQGVAGATGEVDLAGRLRASLRRNRALLAAAHAGTEIERRNLLLATVENYYGLAVATARRMAAEANLRTATDFQQTTDLMEKGGEVAQVDSIRARLSTSARRDELEQARAAESVAIESLRVLIGYEPAQPVVVADLSTEQPDVTEIDRFTLQMIAQRPELAQLDAQRAALAEEAKQARAERWPQITYNIIGGFETDSLRAQPLREHSGVQATVGMTIPIFDWGASRSRQRQAEYRMQSLDSARRLAQRNFNQQFTTARQQALSAAERVRLARAGIVDAQRNLEISIARYRAGEAQIIEVTDAQNTLTGQRTSLYQSVFDYQLALARLKQSTGQAAGQ